VFDIGESLAAARRAQGLDLAAAEELTCIRQRNLQALESERFELLPGWTYTRAFLRTYANALGLDADRFVAEFEERFPEPVDEIPLVLPRRRRQVPMRLFLVIAALASVGVFVAWSGTANDKISTPPAANAAPPPRHVVHVVKAARVVSAPAPKPVLRTLVIRAISGDCWVQVRRGGATGPVIYESTLHQGGTLRFGPVKLWIRFGAPWNVDVRRGGKPVAGITPTQRTPIDLLA